MLKLGASPNVLVESSGSRPLTAAAEGGHLGIVKLLLDSGADPNLQDNWVSMPPNGTALENAALKGHLEIVKLLIKRGAEIDKQGYWPPLKSAVSHGQPETVRYLLSLGAKWESSWLLLGVRVRNIEVVRLLIKAGADVNYKTKDGETALHIATWNPSANMTDLLLKAGAKVDVQKWHTNETPLHGAAQHGSLEVVQSLLKAGSSITLKG